MAVIAITVTDAWLKLRGAAEAGTDLAQITFLAVGTGTTTPTVNDTALVSESATSGARIAVSVTPGTNPGEITVTGTMQASDAVNVAITEVGLFAGKSATSAKGSGILIGRALYSHTKTQNETLTLSFDLTI